MTSRNQVLLVEDDADVALLMTTRLELLGYEVRVATTGAEAVAEAAAWGPDLLLLDIQLPDFDGWEVARRIAAGGNEAPTVVVASILDAPSPLPAEVADFLVKPFSMAQVERTTARLLPLNNDNDKETR